MNELLEPVLAALERGERLALITMVRSVGSTPRHSAARQVVFGNGHFQGTIGGGSMELQAVADARAALAEGQPRLIEYRLTGRDAGNVGLCGGTEEVFIDLLEPARDAARRSSSTGGTVELLRAIRGALAGGEAMVLATLIRTEGADDLFPGAKRALGMTGDAAGSLGDARLDQALIEEARRTFADGYARRLGFDPATGAIQRLMATQRAAVEIFLDIIEPRPRLLIVGAGHIGAALARLGKFLGWGVCVVDDRPGFATPDHLPDADEIRRVAYNSETEQLGPLDVRVTPDTAVVVATWGWDEPALRQLAGAPGFYVGLVASLRKAVVIFDTLRAEGIDPAWLDRVRVPVGLDLRAESPEEIALAIMAEILMIQRKASGQPLMERKGWPAVRRRAEGQLKEVAGT
ncbi:MAG TPA: hypothetical protein DEP84_36220 [Chloroflexi bacterium]|nr:hypothetical protein [Chloroflexota bacterium]